MLPITAIIGRPNTGKSTLFNRLVGTQHAITSKIAGTTRDRIYRHATISETPTIVVDTGGLNFESANDDFDKHIVEQAQLAISEADIILFVIDSSEPLLANDIKAAKIARKTNKPVILVANKADRKISDAYKAEIFKLGFKNIHFVAAISNYNMVELEEAIATELKKAGSKQSSESTESRNIKIGFIGKPNVGKSSLVNKLLGKEQVIVSEVSGTTRDSTHLNFTYNDQELTLVDTAGIRRRGKQTGIEKFSVFRTLKTIDEIDVALLIIDGSIGLAKQDMHVSEFILEAAKGLVIVVNKADLMKPEEKNQLLKLMQHRMQYVPWAPVVFTSAKTGTNINQILELSLEIFQERQKRIDTSKLNFFIRKTTLAHPPSSKSARQPKITFVTQPEINPPTFVFFCKNKDKLHFSYKRYLENKIREEYGFSGTAIIMNFKSGDGRKSLKDKD